MPKYITSRCWRGCWCFLSCFCLVIVVVGPNNSLSLPLIFPRKFAGCHQVYKFYKFYSKISPPIRGKAIFFCCLSISQFLDGIAQHSGHGKKHQTPCGDRIQLRKHHSRCIWLHACALARVCWYAFISFVC